MYGVYSDLYARWCDCYDPEQREIAILKKYCDFRNSDILDIGCGTGRFLLKVLPEIRRIVGVDIDSESLEILCRKIESAYIQYKDHVQLECRSIADYTAKPGSFDYVFFTWSFYALNKEEMFQSLRNISTMLRENGKMIILQPTGGEFEKVMRLFFAEHEDMEEYDTSLALMDQVMPDSLERVAVELIHSAFEVSDLVHSRPAGYRS